MRVLWRAALECVAGGDAVAADLASIPVFFYAFESRGRDGGVAVKGKFSP